MHPFLGKQAAMAAVSPRKNDNHAINRCCGEKRRGRFAGMIAWVDFHSELEYGRVPLLGVVLRSALILLYANARISSLPQNCQEAG